MSTGPRQWGRVNAKRDGTEDKKDEPRESVKKAGAKVTTATGEGGRRRTKKYQWKAEKEEELKEKKRQAEKKRE